MDGHNQSPDEIKIVNDANTQIVDSDSEQNNAAIDVLRNQVLQLKATNASLNAEIQNLRDKHLPYVFLVDDNYDTIQIITDILHDNYNII